MDTDVFTAPVTLEGRYVRLEPLTLAHAQPLFEACRDERIWSYLLVEQPMDLPAMEDWIADALAEQEAGNHLAFSIVRKDEGEFVGSTRYLDIRPFDRSLEIGWTWLRPDTWNTVVNSECKYLLLKHAFEGLGCQRVQLKTDAQNERSRRAIEGIGATLEGVLRNYQRYWHGGLRDTAMYAITDAYWPDTRVRLEERIARLGG